jgi:hypothetical protein
MAFLSCPPYLTKHNMAMSFLGKGFSMNSSTNSLRKSRSEILLP